MNLQEYLSERQGRINHVLEGFLTSGPGLALTDAMRYSALDGGKRIRPILTLAAAEAVGGTLEDALPAACAVECIHCFSLIHDDLPCMDDDNFRRGKPTNHKVYGEATALLAGDALLALAFELLAQTPSHISRAAVVDAVGVIARATGAAGMTGGQAMDLQAEGKEVTLADVEAIHRMKTGALLEASVVAGAIIGGANEQQKQALGQYGCCIGLAFQIMDDVLDLTGDQEKLGKTVGADLHRNKATYPSILGIEESKRLATEAIGKAMEELAPFGKHAEPLRLIAKLIVERES